MDRWPLIRTLLLFFGGLAGMVHQTLFVESAQPVLIGAFLVMMGLTIPLLVDEGFGSRQKGKDSDE